MARRGAAALASDEQLRSTRVSSSIMREPTRRGVLLAITLTLPRYAHRLRFVGRVEALDEDIRTLRLGFGFELGSGLGSGSRSR